MRSLVETWQMPGAGSRSSTRECVLEGSRVQKHMAFQTTRNTRHYKCKEHKNQRIDSRPASRKSVRGEEKQHNSIGQSIHNARPLKTGLNAIAMVRVPHQKWHQLMESVIGHIIPFFCPQRLLPYQSMNEEDPLWPLQYTHPPKLEQLSMDQGDISRRLPDKVLECLWVMESQKMPLELPQWTARDPVVKRMATLAAEHSSSPLSCSPRPSFSIPSESTTPPTRVTSEQSSISQTHPEGKPHAAAQQLPEPTLQSSRKVPAQTLRKSQQQRHRKKADTSRLPKPSWSKERIHQSKSRIQKRSTHSMRTRSQGAPVSYAL